jgi:hypothetical protein
MGVDISTWRWRIGSFRGCSFHSCNIAYNCRSTLKLIILTFIAAIVIEIGLVIAGIELNPGPVFTQLDGENRVLHCNTCGLNLNIPYFDLYNASTEVSSGSNYICKSCILEKKIDDLFNYVKSMSISLCIKLDSLKKDVEFDSQPSINENTQVHVFSDGIDSMKMKNNLAQFASFNSTFSPTFFNCFITSSKHTQHQLLNLQKGSVAILQCGARDLKAFKNKGDKWLQEFSKILEVAVDKGIKVIVSTILPRKKALNTWYNLALSTNDKIIALCMKYDVNYINGWQDFWRKDYFFENDGINLSSLGVKMLGDLWNSKLHKIQTINKNLDSHKNNSQSCTTSSNLHFHNMCDSKKIITSTSSNLASTTTLSNSTSTFSNLNLNASNFIPVNTSVKVSTS